MMVKYCLDASALFIYLTEKEQLSDLDRVISEIEKGSSEGLISTVNLAEFHRAITRSFSQSKADKYIIWIRESRIQIADLGEEMAIKASSLKQQYAKARSPFAWGDAFCLATAIIMNCDVLVTTDNEFDKVKEIEMIKV